MMRTFADSTKTPGQRVTDRCYILAQFPETLNFDWARDLRGLLGGDELKYEKYIDLRHRVQADKKLWSRVQNGTAEATIIVIENSYYIDAIAFRLKMEGAEIGHDVTFDDLLREAALCMINHAPIMRLQTLNPDFVMAMPPAVLYTPESVYSQIGAKLNDAAVFAARAHAAFDVDDLKNAASTNELFFGPFRRTFALKLREIDRVFDTEHPKSAFALNELFANYDERTHQEPTVRISEVGSETHDALQAADFTAGFASEIMMNAINDREKELRRHFRRVIFNGATK